MIFVRRLTWFGSHVRRRGQVCVHKICKEDRRPTANHPLPGAATEDEIVGSMGEGNDYIFVT